MTGQSIQVILVWWLISVSMALASAPIALRLFRSLPHKGYAFTRALGALLTGYVLWICTSLGFLSNSTGSIVVSISLVLLIGISLEVRDRSNDNAIGTRQFFRQEWRHILFVELLFFVTFILFAWYRSQVPNISGTEKPMDVAFISSILRSTQFPPQAPWMSGHGISYYYFGYLITAMMTKLADVSSSIGYNLGLTWVFASTVTSAFGVAFSLVRVSIGTSVRSWLDYLMGVIGSLSVAILGNLEGFLELVKANAWLPDAFWAWLDIPELVAASPVSFSWPPRVWWWWRASRVIHDYSFAGEELGIQPIDEFPFFSFLLGDHHPHVLALPYVLMVIGLALNLFLLKWQSDDSQHSWSIKDLFRQIGPIECAIVAVSVGALGFLNTWDLPIYIGLLSAAVGISRFRSPGGKLDSAIKLSGVVALTLTIASLLFYLPFYLGFRSQAGGVLPYLDSPTRLIQYLVMFGPLMVTVAAWSLSALVRLEVKFSRIIGTALVLFVVVSLLSILVAATIWMSKSAELTALAESEYGGITQAVYNVFRIKLKAPLTAIFLYVLIGSAAAGLINKLPSRESANIALPQHNGMRVYPFVFLMIIVGSTLTLIPEYVFIVDVFRARANTIFKFYFQGWILFALIVPFMLYDLANRRKWLWVFLSLLIMVPGVVYPALAIPSRISEFDQEPTIDGMQFMRDRSPGDGAAVDYIRQNARADSVILEAVDGQYTNGGRISAFSGVPTVMGWAGHELQWRGSHPDISPRESDVERMYSLTDWMSIQALLDKYSIEYVVIGDLERARYGGNAGEVITSFCT
ncbi:MAG: DUF2298 domain-containing protein, partial [Chloroflexota bacterium]